MIGSSSDVGLPIEARPYTRRIGLRRSRGGVQGSKAEGLSLPSTIGSRHWSKASKSEQNVDDEKVGTLGQDHDAQSDPMGEEAQILQIHKQSEETLVGASYPKFGEPQQRRR